jgi:chromate transporter
VIFGSGYVLFAVLRGDLVERYQWLSEEQLLDAIAVGQVTPGPVFTSATFIGYLLGGTTGALAATIGIFLPAFAFTALSARLLERLRGSSIARAFLDGVSAAAVALIGVVVLALGRAAIVDATTAALAVGAIILIVWLRVNSAWVILGGALAGALLRF